MGLFSRREKPVVGRLSLVVPVAEAGAVAFSLDNREDGPMQWEVLFGELLSAPMPPPETILRTLSEAGIAIAKEAIPSLTVGKVHVEYAPRDGKPEIRVSADASFLASHWDSKNVFLQEGNSSVQ